MKNAGKLEENEVLREVKKRREVEMEKEKEEEKRRKEEEKRKEELQIAKNVLTLNPNKSEFSNANCYRVGVMVVSDNCCNESDFVELDLKGFVNLRELNVGDECFKNVNEVKLIGLKQLESVAIGKSFTKHKNSWGDDPNRYFYLKNCERVRELKIGCYSFYDYSVCEIENVPSLEVIEMGELNEWSNNFFYASLELKSDCDELK